MVNYPKFSIVIPTRDRASTLEHSIRTCLNQNYIGDYEIIVSDNNSSDDTFKVVQSFSSEKIKYFNTGERLSLSHNWEFAINQASGDYVSLLGDDDAYLPGALTDIADIFRETKAEALSWNQAQYHWPDYIVQKDRNILTVPLGVGLEKRSSKKILQDVLDFRRGYTDLAFLYKGMVSRSILERVKQESGGQLIHSTSADVYCALVLASACEFHYYSHKPFTINATSSNSIGTSQFLENVSSEPFKKWMSESPIPFHPKASFCASITMYVYESYLQSIQYMSSMREHEIKLDGFLDKMVQDACISPPWRYSQILDALIQFGKINNIESIVNEKITSTRYVEPVEDGAITLGYRKRQNTLTLSGDKLLLSNVYDASLACYFVMHHSAADLYFPCLAEMFRMLRDKCSNLPAYLSRKLRRIFPSNY